MLDWKTLLLAGAALLMPAAAQAQARWNPAPWLQDLEQVREAFHTRYANREWLKNDREVDIDAVLDRVAARLKTVGSDDAARALLDKLAERIADGHVGFRWPAPPSPAGSRSPAPSDAAGFCRRLGYNGRAGTAGIGAMLPGFTPVDAGELFPTGIAPVGAERVGILRIPIFQPQGYPSLCTDAVTAQHIPLDKPCDAQCEDTILTAAYRTLMRTYEERLRSLRAAGATVLLVDITGNGGGSEWAEAAARSLTPREIVSARMGFVRGTHWSKQWGELAQRLREAARSAPKQDRARLLAWATEAESARTEAETPCDPATACEWLGRAGYATGLVGSAPASAFRGKDWGPYVFSAGQHDYHPGSWAGPLIVLVDQETWSAAEEFAAMLQDNRVAVILGARTGGAGCGHTYGGTPVTLTNSKGVLEIPDCVRFRADGSNEVNGIVPDVTIGWRASDGAKFRAKLLAAALSEAVAAARRVTP